MAAAFDRSAALTWVQLNDMDVAETLQWTVHRSTCLCGWSRQCLGSSAVRQSDAQTCGQTLLQLVLTSQLQLLRACPLKPEACQQPVQTLGRDLAAGTPVQNNMRELYGLMNLLDDDKYSDEEEFFDKFGGDKEAIKLEQVQALQVCPRNLLNIVIFLLPFHSMLHHKTIYYTIIWYSHSIIWYYAL